MVIGSLAASFLSFLPSFLPSLVLPHPVLSPWVSRLGFSLGTYHLAIARLALLVMIAGIDDRAERFFQIVSLVGNAGIHCVC